MAPLREPRWWSWELEHSPHVEQRMVDRDFSEVDLRRMIETAREVVPDHVEGRWQVRTALEKRPWVVIVEPDDEERCIVVVTAYPEGRP